MLAATRVVGGQHGPPANLWLAGLGDHAGVFVGYSNKNSPIKMGGYGEAFGRGGGAYVNVVPGGGCHK